MAVWETTHLLGPFAFESISRSTLNLQLYIAVAALSTLLLAAVVAERERFAEGLSVARVRMVESTDEERQRIARNIHDGAQQRLVALAVHLRLGARRRATATADWSRGDGARQELQLAMDELRELAHGVHPASSRSAGSAVRWPAWRSARRCR